MGLLTTAQHLVLLRGVRPAKHKLTMAQYVYRETF